MLNFFDFANAFNLVCCDDLNHSNVNYSYHHETLGHFSLLDHVFVTSDLKACVANCSIVNDHLNPSDHLAVSFCLKPRRPLPVLHRWQKPDSFSSAHLRGPAGLVTRPSKVHFVCGGYRCCTDSFRHKLRLVRRRRATQRQRSR
jgi:hypothetical protein